MISIIRLKRVKKCLINAINLFGTWQPSRSSRKTNISRSRPPSISLISWNHSDLHRKNHNTKTKMQPLEYIKKIHQQKNGMIKNTEIDMRQAVSWPYLSYLYLWKSFCPRSQADQIPAASISFHSQFRFYPASLLYQKPGWLKCYFEVLRLSCTYISDLY